MLDCVLDYFAPCNPPTTTAQQKGAFVRNGQVRFYTKPEVKRAMDSWWEILRPAKAELPAPIEGGIFLAVDLTFPYIASTPKRVVRAAASVPMAVRPDVDNVFKALGDVMTRMRFWYDDGQICRLYLSKWRGANPGVRVRIWRAEALQQDIADLFEESGRWRDD